MYTTAPAPPAPLSGQTRDRILDAAERCMTRHGIRRVSMSDVATQAGVSRGGVYLHFTDRAALVDAVLARVAARFVASSEAPVRRRRTLAAQVAEAAVFILDHMGDEGLTLRLLAEEENLFAVLLTAQSGRLVAEWIDFWQPLLAQAEQRGELRPGLDRRQAGEWIVRLLLSFAVLPAVTFDRDDPRSVRAFVGTHIVSGLGPLPAATEP